ncbi:hypothetical protein [Rhizobium sp. Rhizsp82]|uniref:hypothetical protein n=1 Tax=Rhizobium sp. Rhizsp82 TaxID=3243057 RepID=UPI0039B6C01D
MDWQTFSNNWGFNPATITTALLGLAVTYWVYIRPAKPRICYNVSSSVVTSETDPAYSTHIKVLYKDAEIPRATLSQVSIWNEGVQPIRRSDIAPKSPLCLTVPGGQHILQFAVTHMASHAMDASLHWEDEGSIRLDFEYIDAKQGIILDVLHTGTLRDLSVEGDLISAAGPIREPLPSQSISNRMFLAVMLVGVSCPLLVMYLVNSSTGPSWSPAIQMLSAAAFLIGTIGWLIIVVGFAMARSQARIKFGKPNH